MLVFDPTNKSWSSPRRQVYLPGNYPLGAGTAWDIYFQDNFNSMDTDVWYRYHNTYGDGFNTVDHLRPENIIADSTLKIITKRETYNGKDFTSGFISTGRRGTQAQPEPAADTFFPREAFFEARCKVRHGQGLIQAFWLRHRAGATTAADISIMEWYHNQTPGKPHLVLNLDGDKNTYKVTPFVEDPQQPPAWHTYGLSILEEDGVPRFRFYIDGVLVGNYLPTLTGFWDNYLQDELWDISINTHTGGDYAGHPDDGNNPALEEENRLGLLRNISPKRCAIGYVTTGYPDDCNVSLDGYPIMSWYDGSEDAVFETDYVKVWTPSG